MLQMRNAVLVVSALAAAASVVSGEVGLGVFLKDAATNDMAVCLDGTPGVYYIAKGTGDGVNKWYIHHEGGGWCVNNADCLGRSNTTLGSRCVCVDLDVCVFLATLVAQGLRVWRALPRGGVPHWCASCYSLEVATPQRGGPSLRVHELWSCCFLLFRVGIGSPPPLCTFFCVPCDWLLTTSAFRKHFLSRQQNVRRDARAGWRLLLCRPCI